MGKSSVSSVLIFVVAVEVVAVEGGRMERKKKGEGEFIPWSRSLNSKAGCQKKSLRWGEPPLVVDEGAKEEVEEEHQPVSPPPRPLPPSSSSSLDEGKI